METHPASITVTHDKAEWHQLEKCCITASSSTTMLYMCCTYKITNIVSVNFTLLYNTLCTTLHTIFPSYFHWCFLLCLALFLFYFTHFYQLFHLLTLLLYVLYCSNMLHVFIIKFINLNWHRYKVTFGCSADVCWWCASVHLCRYSI